MSMQMDLNGLLKSYLSEVNTARTWSQRKRKSFGSQHLCVRKMVSTRRKQVICRLPGVNISRASMVSTKRKFFLGKNIFLEVINIECAGWNGLKQKEILPNAQGRNIFCEVKHFATMLHKWSQQKNFFSGSQHESFSGLDKRRWGRNFWYNAKKCSSIRKNLWQIFS